MRKISPSTSNVAHWAGGSWEGRTHENKSGEGEQWGEASQEEVEEWHLAVIVPTIYEAR